MTEDIPRDFQRHASYYRTNYHLDIPAALTLLATVTSRPTATRIIIDAGKKAMSSDGGADAARLWR